MNDLLMGLCSYLALSTPMQNDACHKAVDASYISSPIYAPLTKEQKYWEAYGTEFYKTIPYNEPIGAIAYVLYDVHQNKYEIPVTSFLKLSYDGCNFKSNFHWSW